MRQSSVKSRKIFTLLYLIKVDKLVALKSLALSLSKLVSEYDQEIPQSQTADNPVAP